MFGMKKKKEEGPASFSFKDLFSNSQQERAIMAKDQIADLLNTTPEALAAFESSYQRDILNNTTEDGHFFGVSAKQAADMIPSVDPSEAAKELHDTSLHLPGCVPAPCGAWPHPAGRWS